MRKNFTVNWESKGTYATDLFTDEAVFILFHLNALCTLHSMHKMYRNSSGEYHQNA